MSILIGCFLAFSGLMTGYLLWYRDRNEEQQIHQRLKNELKDLTEKFQLAKDQHWKSEEQIDRQRNQIDVLKQLCEDWSQSREKIENERTELLVSLRRQQEKHEKLMGQMLAAQQKMVELEDEVITHHKSLQYESKSQQSVAWENRELKLQLQTAQQSLETCEEKHAQSISQLEAASNDQRQLQTELTAMQSRLSNQESTIDRMHRQQIELTTELEQQATWQELKQVELQQQAEKKIAQFQVRLQNSETTIRRLQQYRNELKKELNKLQQAQLRLMPQVELDSTVVSFSQAMEARQRSQFDEAYGGHFQRHPLLGMVYSEAPKRRDDLKRISGIAEILEARLNDLGIYTFKQIMDWSPEAIKEVAHLFQFKERIERDCWQEQAASLFRRESEMQAETRQRAA